VERHARADHVVVRLAREDTRAVLEVRDDGVGLGASADAERGEHLGLRIVGDLVEEAGGRVVLAPGVGGGTVVRVEVPLS
jgi:signal transduction histidine kinase